MMRLVPNIRSAWEWSDTRLAMLRAWRHFFPAPEACQECGGPLRDHKLREPLTAKHFLDREHFYGSRLRAESDGILVNIYIVNCDGSVRDSLLLLSSDCETLRDALEDYLPRESEFYQKAQAIARAEINDFFHNKEIR